MLMTRAALVAQRRFAIEVAGAFQCHERFLNFE
jgi:hypothetical protein